jgi:hypothetical protein
MFWPDESRGTMATRAALLIPASIVLAVSWVLGRMTVSDVDRRRSPSPGEL